MNSGSLSGRVLKARRKELGFSVKYVLEQLQNMGINISDKTLYGWENGHRQPDADSFLILCKIYNIGSINGIDKIPRKIGEALSFPNEYEEKLIELYRSLNLNGKERLIELADDMVKSQKYLECGPISGGPSSGGIA